MVVSILQKSVIVLLLAGGLAEAVWGYGQFLGVWPSGNSRFVFTGSFYNPGPYSGFLSMVIAIALFEWKRLKSKQHWSQGLLGMLCTLMIILLPAGRSRAAWLALGVAAVYYLYCNQKEAILKKLFQNRLATLTGCFVLILTFGGIYHLKKDSADGRLFIWKNAIHAIAKNPWKGCGWDHVAGVYGEQQEAYFSSGNGTEAEKRIADAPDNIFNEFLQAAMAWGVPSAMAIILILVYTFYIGHQSESWSLCAGLLSLATFAFFSYPFQFPEFCICLFLIVAGIHLSAIEKFDCVRKEITHFILIGSTIAVLAYGQWVIERHQHEQEWRLHRKSQQELYPDMKWNAQFLFDYGLRLHRSGEYSKSEEVMNTGMQVSSDPMFLVIQGKNAWYQKHPKEAERWLQRAANRVPNRIYPHYLLAKLYSDSAFLNRERFLSAAEIVLNRDAKVPSTAVRQMREEIQKLKEERWGR